MHHVVSNFPVEDFVPETRVWISDHAWSSLHKFKKKHQQTIVEMLKRLRRFMRNGFGASEGKEKDIRPEGQGVFRIGHQSELFRMLGFYEHDNRTSFIVILVYLKRGQDANTDLIKEVARVKREKDWSRKDDGKGPRLARYA